MRRDVSTELYAERSRRRHKRRALLLQTQSGERQRSLAQKRCLVQPMKHRLCSKCTRHGETDTALAVSLYVSILDRLVHLRPTLDETNYKYQSVISIRCTERTLWERTTRTGRPFWQDSSNALFIRSNFWSKDCTCGHRFDSNKFGEARRRGSTHGLGSGVTLCRQSHPAAAGGMAVPAALSPSATQAALEPFAIVHAGLEHAALLSRLALEVRLLPLRSRPPLPVYRKYSPWSRSSSYLH